MRVQQRDVGGAGADHVGEIASGMDALVGRDRNRLAPLPAPKPAQRLAAQLAEGVRHREFDGRDGHRRGALAVVAAGAEHVAPKLLRFAHRHAARDRQRDLRRHGFDRVEQTDRLAPADDARVRFQPHDQPRRGGAPDATRGRRAAGSQAEDRTMEPWLRHALDYIPEWLAHQMRQSELPGCLIAVAHRGEIVLDQAFGLADIATGEAMTPRHRFRVASHSKSFTAAGVMRLREMGKLSLDDAIGRYVPGLHADVAAVTLAQLLSHSGGITRDGTVQDQFVERRPFAGREEVLADVAAGVTIPSNTRFKYSNHGFALAGMAIEAITGERWHDWMAREIIAAFGLEETTPDMPLPAGTPFARGHTPKLPLGRRLVIEGESPGNAIAPAGGMVSTAADLARFFGMLAPEAESSPLSVASRREMTRRQWKNPDVVLEMWYGLGTMSGTVGAPGGWDRFGHSGRLGGYVSRTAVVPAEDLSIAILINATDGLPDFWSDGALNVLRAFRTRGAPPDSARDWRGRWWSHWRPVDLLPCGDRVLMLVPGYYNPMMDMSEIEITGTDQGRIVRAPGVGNHGERVRLVRDGTGAVRECHLTGARYLPEAELTEEFLQKFRR
jgi:CubicO group peptidase (beta-lactamase class C family)